MSEEIQILLEAGGSVYIKCVGSQIRLSARPPIWRPPTPSEIGVNNLLSSDEAKIISEMLLKASNELLQEELNDTTKKF